MEKSRLPLLLSTADLYGAVNNEDDATPVDEGLVNAASIQTYYEQMWLERGIPIKYMKFLLPTDGTLEEPDVEIPLDDYRSYHRSKRTPRETAK